LWQTTSEVASTKAIPVSWPRQRHQGGGNQGHKPIVTQQVGKLTPAMWAHWQQMKGLEVAVPRLMEIKQDRHDFTEGQITGPPSLAGTLHQELTMPGGQEDLAELINVTE